MPCITFTFIISIFFLMSGQNNWVGVQGEGEVTSWWEGRGWNSWGRISWVVGISATCNRRVCGRNGRGCWGIRILTPTILWGIRIISWQGRTSAVGGVVWGGKTREMSVAGLDRRLGGRVDCGVNCWVRRGCWSRYILDMAWCQRRGRRSEGQRYGAAWRIKISMGHRRQRSSMAYILLKDGTWSKTGWDFWQLAKFKLKTKGTNKRRTERTKQVFI